MHRFWSLPDLFGVISAIYVRMNSVIFLDDGGFEVSAASSASTLDSSPSPGFVVTGFVHNMRRGGLLCVLRLGFTG